MHMSNGIIFSIYFFTFTYPTVAKDASFEGRVISHLDFTRFASICNSQENLSNILFKSQINQEICSNLKF